MAACDVCNAAMALDQGVVYTAEELDALIAKGFEPPERMIGAAMAAGWSKAQVIARWKEELAGRLQPYWTLCPACAARAAHYVPQPEPEPEPVAPEPEPVPPVPAKAAPPPPVEAPEAAPAAAEEAPPAEEPAPAEERLPLAPPARRQWLTGGRVALVLLAALAAGLGLGYLLTARVVYPDAPVAWSTRTPTPVPTQPTATPTITPSPRPSNTPAPTPWPDLSAVALEQGDLPEGFVAMAAADQETWGITAGDLVSAYATLFQAPPQHLAVLTNNKTTSLNFAGSFLIYPLTTAEQEAFARYLSDPAVGAHILAAGLVERGWSNPRPLADEAEAAKIAGLGDQALGLIVTGPGRSPPQMKVAMVRRDGVLEVFFVGYRGEEPLVPFGVLADLLDKRVAAALP